MAPRGGRRPVSRVLWLNTHPLPAISEKTDKPAISVVPVGGDRTKPKRGRPLGNRGAIYKRSQLLRLALNDFFSTD
jgi:hypothetical protein